MPINLEKAKTPTVDAPDCDCVDASHALCLGQTAWWVEGRRVCSGRVVTVTIKLIRKGWEADITYRFDDGEDRNHRDIFTSPPSLS